MNRTRLREEYPYQAQAVFGVEAAPQRPLLETHCRFFGRPTNQPDVACADDLVSQNRRNETFDVEMTYRRVALSRGCGSQTNAWTVDAAVPQTYAYDFFNFSKPPLAWEEKRKDVRLFFAACCS
jgi:hypothetical protein